MSWPSFIVMLVAAASYFPADPPAEKEPPFVAEIRGLQEQLDKVGQENVFREYKSKSRTQEAAHQRIDRLLSEVGNPLARKIASTWPGRTPPIRQPAESSSLCLTSTRPLPPKFQSSQRRGGPAR